jgi:hypothetical protein
MIGRKKQDNNNGSTLIFVNKVGKTKSEGYPKEDSKGVPYFAFSQKVGDKYETTQKNDRFSGTLKKVSVEWKYDEKRDAERIKKYKNSKVVKLELFDPETNETYVWKASPSMAARSVFNSILNLEHFDDVEIKVGLNKKDYESMWVRQGGDLVNWKHSLEEIPEPIKVQVRGETISDYTPSDDFFFEKLAALDLGSAAPATAESHEEAPHDTGAEEDEIPF